jgi:hypothetical protein
MTRNTITALAALAALTCFASQAYAGRKQLADVVVNTATRTASGGLGAARASLDATQSIGCFSQENMTTHVKSGGCQAKSGGVSVSCTFPTDTAGMYSFTVGLQMLTTDSNIKFTWSSAGVCTSLVISNYSYYQPKIR